MYLDPVDEDYAIFKIQMPRGSWFGLGLGSAKMEPGSDLIQIDGTELKVYDKYSVGKTRPEMDDEQNVVASFKSLPDNLLEVTLRRALDTGDIVHDYLIPAYQPFELSWALHSGTGDVNAKH